MIDWCVFMVWVGVVALVSWYFQIPWPENPWLAQACGFPLTTLPFGIYLVLLDGSARQATIGKRILGLRVMTLAGQRISRGSSFLRAAIKLLPWELGHVAPWQLTLGPQNGEVPDWVMVFAILGMGGTLWYFVSLWLGDGRTPYDRLAATRVARI